MFVCTQEALGELAAWLDAHPKEIVMICCSHFESLSDSDHDGLVEYIITLFREKLCSSQVEKFNCIPPILSIIYIIAMN